MICYSQDLLSRRLNLLAPGGEEITMVTWEELEQVIGDGWRASKGVKQMGSSTGWYSREHLSYIPLSHILLFGPSLLTL
jgi:hypothetical protein